jgi:DNA invertase Pin-like site-specific DNA recombinase
VRHHELLRIVTDLQPGEVVAEKIDRISRPPLPDAELLVATIREKWRLAVPGIDFLRSRS